MRAVKKMQFTQFTATNVLLRYCLHDAIILVVVVVGI